MAGQQIDLSFLGGGRNSISAAELAAIDNELKDIAARSPAMIELARNFGITYEQVKKLTAELGLAPAAIQQSVATMRSLRAAGADAVTQYAVLSNTLGLSVDQMEMLSKSIDDFAGQTPQLSEINQAFAQIFVLDKVRSFSSAVKEAGMEFEGLNAKLKTTLGTQEAASAAFADLEVFAATTPYELNEITDNFVKLKSRGIEPTNEVLTKLGDLAASQGKSFDQLTEAVLDAATGEFERLKEFGVKASAAGDKVNLSFMGVTKQVERSEKGISAGIVAMGAMDGVAGGMAEKANTLSGAMSNLTDNQTKLATEMYKMVQGPAVAFVKIANELYTGFFSLSPLFQKTVLAITGLGGAFVLATASVAAFNIAQVKAGIETIRLAAATVAGTVAKGASITATTLATIAQGAYALAVGNTASAEFLASKAMLTRAAAMATVGGAALGAAAALALVVEGLSRAGAVSADFNKATSTLTNSLAAYEAAKQKRLDTEKAAAKATMDSAEAERISKLSIAERTAELEKSNAAITKAFEQSMTEATGPILGFFDVLTTPLRAVTDLLEPLRSGVANVVGAITGIQLPVDGIKSYKEAFSEIAQMNQSTLFTINAGDLSLQFAEAKKATKGFTSASKQEVEALNKAYESQIEAIKKTVPANADLASQKEVTLRRLEAEREQLVQANKLLEEQAKRVVAVGDAQTQWNAELEKGTEKLTKQLATSEDAEKQIDITKKLLENGFISDAQAEAALNQVAKYQSATGDVQIAAVDALQELKEKQFEKERGLLEASVRNEELLRLQGVKTAEQSATAIAQIKIKQAQVEIEAAKAALAIEEGAGRGGGDKADKARADIEKAINDEKKAKIEAKRAEADQKLAETKKGLDAENAALEASISQEELLRLTGVKTVEESATAIAEIKVKQAAVEIEQIKAVIAAEAAAGTANSDKAIKARQDLTKALINQQKAAAEARIAAEKEAQAKILKVMEDSEKELQNKSQQQSNERKAAILAAVSKGGADIEAIEKKDRKEQLIADKEQIDAQIAIKQKAAAALAGVGGKEAKEQKEKLEQEILKLTGDSLDKQIQMAKEAEEERRKAIQESIDKEKERLAIANDSKQIAADKKLAEQRLASAGVVGKEREKIDKDLADKAKQNAVDRANDAIQAAKAEAAAVEQLIAAGIIKAEDAANKRAAANNAINKAETDAINARADLAESRAQRAHQEKLNQIKEAIRLESERANANDKSQELAAEESLAKLRLSTAHLVGEERKKIEEEIEKRREQIALAASESQIAAAKREQEAVEKQIEAGIISAEDAETRRIEAANRVKEAEVKNINTRADIEIKRNQRIYEKRLEAIREALRLEQERANAQNASKEIIAEKTLAQLRLANAGKIGDARDKIEREIANKQKELQVEAADRAIEAAERERAATEKMIAGGLIEAKDVETKRLEATNKVQSAEVAAINARADLEATKTQQLFDEKINNIKETLRIEQEAAAADETEEKLANERILAEQRLAAANLVGEKRLKVEEEIALKQKQIALTSAQANIAAAEREQAATEKMIQAGLISAKDAATRRQEANNKVTEAQNGAINAQADLEELITQQVLKRKIDALDTELSKRRMIADAAISIRDQEAEGIRRINELRSAQERVESLQKESQNIALGFQKQELEIAAQLAEAKGDDKTVAEIKAKLQRMSYDALLAENAEIDKQFQRKRANLELDIRSRELAAEKLVIEKEMAALEAKAAVEQAKVEGKSAQEIAILEQKAGLADKALENAILSKENDKEIAALSRQALGLEEANAKNQNTLKIKAMEGAAAVEAAKTGTETALPTSNRGLVGPTEYDPKQVLTEATSKLGETGNAAGTLTTSFNSLAEAVAAFQRILGTTPSQTPQPGGNDGSTLRRALGGSVPAGRVALVGEFGPELVKFDTDANVWSNDDTRRLLGGLTDKAKTAATGNGDARMLSELQRMGQTLNQLLNKQPPPIAPINVPVTVHKTYESTADALELIKAERARRYSAYGSL